MIKRSILMLLLLVLLPTSAIATVEPMINVPSITTAQEQALEIEIIRVSKHGYDVAFTYPTTKARQLLAVDKFVIEKRGKNKGSWVRASSARASTIGGEGKATVYGLKSGEEVLLQFFWKEYPEGKGFPEIVPLFEILYTPEP